MSKELDIKSFIMPAVLPEKYLKAGSSDRVVVMETISSGKVVKIKFARQKFFPPMPEWWVIAVHRVVVRHRSLSAWLVGMVLWQQLNMRKRQPLRVTRKVWANFGLSRVVIRRALRVLESGGLIAVQRFKHRTPIITIVTDRGR